MYKGKIDKKFNIPLIIGGVFTILRLLLSMGLMVYFVPDSGYDDIMQITKALAISSGQWLGEYGSMTLVKGVGFPLITALFHTLHIPYILGYQALYCGACLMFAKAISPLIKNKYLVLLAYLMVLFNPIAFSNAITRYYRDIAYYSVAFLSISACLCMLTHVKKKWCFFLSGICLCLAATVREDSQWLYIYCIACFAFAIVFEVIDKKITIKDMAVKSVAVLVGFAALALPICTANYLNYSTFTLDEYNSGAYAKAYGALSRFDRGREDSRTTICYEERMALYENSPTFNKLYPYLDHEDAHFKQWKEIQGDYRTGYFSFVLRDAAWLSEGFKNGAQSKEYFNRLSQEVNAYGDSLKGTGRHRNGMTARLYSKDIPKVISATAKGIALTAKYNAVSCIPIQAQADDKYLKVFEEYTGSVCAADRYMPDGSTVENYHLTGANRWAQRFMRVIIIGYRIITPILLAAAVILWTAQGYRCLKNRKLTVKWVASSSLLCAFLLRCAMIGFVNATMFSAIDNPAYQAASYGVMIGFIALQFALWIDEIIKAKSSKQ